MRSNVSWRHRKKPWILLSQWMLFASLVTSHIFTGTIKVNHKERVSNRWSNQSYATFPLVSLIKHLDFIGNWNHKSHRRASSLDFHWIPLEFIKVHSTPTHPSTATACKSAAVLSPKWPGTQRMNQPIHRKPMNLPLLISRRFHHILVTSENIIPTGWVKINICFKSPSAWSQAPGPGNFICPEGVPRSLFPTGPRCPVSNPKGSHLVMKKTTRKTCALGGFEVLRPWTFQEILVVRSQTYEFNGIIMPFLDGKLQPRCPKHQASKCPPGLVPLPSLWTGPSHNSRCQKEQLQHAGEGSEEFFVTSPEKNTHTRSKIRLVAGVEKKYSNMFSSNLYYQWPWKVMHLSMWQWSPWRKTGKRPYGPLCVGPRGAIQQQGSSLWAPFNDLAIWPMSLQWLVLFSNDLVMIYICMYVCMYACMHACMHACMYVCMHVCMHAWMYVCMYECMHAWNYALHYVRKCRKKNEK